MSAGTLYSFAESGNCYKPELLATLLGIELKIVPVDYMKGEMHSPEYLALNPRGQIPCFVDGDRVLTDSAAILVYLAGKYPDRNTTNIPSSFWSNDADEQAQIVDWLVFAATWVTNGMAAARVFACFGKPSTEETRAAAHQKGHQALKILELELANKDWLAANRCTIADIATFVYVALAPMGHISLDPCPAVQAWIERIKKLPGFFPMIGMDDPTYRHK